MDSLLNPKILMSIIDYCDDIMSIMLLLRINASIMVLLRINASIMHYRDNICSIIHYRDNPFES